MYWPPSMPDLKPPCTSTETCTRIILTRTAGSYSQAPPMAHQTYLGAADPYVALPKLLELVYLVVKLTITFLASECHWGTFVQ